MRDRQGLSSRPGRGGRHALTLGNRSNERVDLLLQHLRQRYKMANLVADGGWSEPSNANTNVVDSWRPLITARVFLEPSGALAHAVRNPAAPSTVALIETTLKTSGDQIRQFALDGNEDTCFVSEQNASPADHFTLVFETAVALREIRITTGRPNGSDQLVGRCS